MIARPSSSSFPPLSVIFDLHCHSTASDGALTPRDVVLRAARLGVGALALTDHDTLSGLPEAAAAAEEAGLRFIAGVEVSVTWQGRTVHVVGLNVRPDDPTLLDGLAGNRGGRQARAERIAAALAAVGVGNAYVGALAHAGSPEALSRTHFARFLVERGHVKDMKTVFKKFLVKGKPGYVSHQWAELADAVGWIRAAGGQAVLAHPGRYDLGRDSMRRLIGEFKAAGGEAIEVVAGSHSAEHIPVFARYADEFELLASAGSDFHAPGEGGRELGRLRTLPDACRPIWKDW